MDTSISNLTDPTSHNTEAVRKSLRLYFFVGLILFCGTAATVAVATIPALDVGEHGFDKWDALLGLMIATTKASLVAAIFMHLNHERTTVYVLIVLGLINAGGFFVGTYWHFADIPADHHFYEAGELGHLGVSGGP